MKSRRCACRVYTIYLVESAEQGKRSESPKRATAIHGGCYLTNHKTSIVVLLYAFEAHIKQFAKDLEDTYELEHYLAPCLFYLPCRKSQMLLSVCYSLGAKKTRFEKKMSTTKDQLDVPPRAKSRYNKTRTSAGTASASFHECTITQRQHSHNTATSVGADLTIVSCSSVHSCSLGQNLFDFQARVHHPQTTLILRNSSPHLGRLELGGLVLSHAPLSSCGMCLLCLCRFPAPYRGPRE